MSHLVQQMAYVGETPWHGLGNALSPRQPLETWAVQAGMNFRILETPVRYLSESAGNLGAIMTYPEQKVLYRSDTKTALSVVSSRYQVVQPADILEFYRDLTEVSGFELETAGVLKEGRKVWALARTGQSTLLKGGDAVNAYLLLATACDGTLATTAQFTSIRVVCNNTLAVALGEQAISVKVPHNTVFDPQAVKAQLGVSVSSWDAFMYRMKVLSERKVKSHEAMNYFLRVFTDPASPVSSGTTNDRAIKKVQTLFDGHGHGAEMVSAKDTAWGLLNAVTEFVDHQRRARSQDYRLDSAWFGQGAVIKRKALDEAIKLAA